MTSNMMMLHWHYDEEPLSSRQNKKSEMHYGPYHRPEENEVIGIWFSWRYIIAGSEQYHLECVCQDHYVLNKVPDLRLSDMRLLLLNSYGSFLRMFAKKAKQFNLVIDLPYFELDSVDLSSVYKEIRRQPNFQNEVG